MVLGSVIGITKTNKYSNILDTKPLPNTAETNEKGRNSIIRCPGCKTTLPFHWLIFSGNKSEYSCAKCAAILEWTRRRMIIGAIICGLSAPITMSSKLILDTFWPGIMFAIGLVVFLKLAVPGQYRIREENLDS
jgi:ribosomal protein S27E